MQFSELTHKHLAKTWLFRLSLSIPVIIGLALFSLITNAEPPMSVCFTSECVQNFLTIYKLPIAVIGLALPLVAMAAAIHRSMEAALQLGFISKQYSEAIKNNRFGNYLKHREGFDKVIQSLCNGKVSYKNIKVYVDTPVLYSEAFSGSGHDKVQWNGEIDEDWLETADVLSRATLAELKKTKEDFDVAKASFYISKLAQLVRLSYWPHRMVKFQVPSGKKVDLLGPEYDEIEATVVFAACDALDVVMAVRSYAGLTEIKDYLYGSAVDGALENFNHHAKGFYQND